MNDPQVLPDERITTSPGSPVANLRPSADAPWQSEATSDLPITIRVDLTSDNSDVKVTEVSFPTLRNVDSVVVYLMQSNGDSKSVIVSPEDEQLSSGYTEQLPPLSEGSAILIELTPVNTSSPISVQLEIMACYEEVLPSTSASSTISMEATTTPSLSSTSLFTSTPGTSTSPSFEYTTTRKHSTSTMPTTFTTKLPCALTEVMSKPSLLPTNQISVTPGSDREDLRPYSTVPWQSDPTAETKPYVIVQLTPNGETVAINRIHFPTFEDVKTVDVFFKPSLFGPKVLVASASATNLLANDNSFTFPPETKAAVIEMVYTPMNNIENQPVPIKLRLEILACYEGFSTTSIMSTTTLGTTELSVYPSSPITISISATTTTLPPTTTTTHQCIQQDGE